MPLSDADDSAPWKLRLFLSVDLVGSTALKAREENWLVLFQSFFRVFPEMVVDAYRHVELSRLIEKTGFAAGDPPRPWKFAGDEILFEVPLANHHEVPVHLRAFKLPIQEYLGALPKEKRLGLKATGWTVGFPVTNAEISIGESHLGRPMLRDYLGPSMDLGFRLGRLASKDRFVLSADLAWLLLRALRGLFVKRSDQFAVFYGGREALKGVDDAYPWFWIDMRDGFGHREAEALGIEGGRVHDESLLRFVQEYFDDHAPFERPFIAGDPDPELSAIRPRILDRFERMQMEESRAFANIDPTGVSATDPELPDPEPIEVEPTDATIDPSRNPAP